MELLVEDQTPKFGKFNVPKSWKPLVGSIECTQPRAGRKSACSQVVSRVYLASETAVVVVFSLPDAGRQRLWPTYTVRRVRPAVLRSLLS